MVKWLNVKTGAVVEGKADGSDLPSGTYTLLTNGGAQAPSCGCTPCGPGEGYNAGPFPVQQKGVRIECAGPICDLPPMGKYTCSFDICYPMIGVDCAGAIVTKIPYTGTIVCFPSAAGGGTWVIIKAGECPTIISPLYVDVSAGTPTFWYYKDGEGWYVFEAAPGDGWTKSTDIPKCPYMVAFDYMTGAYIYYPACSERDTRTTLTSVPFCTVLPD